MTLPGSVAVSDGITLATSIPTYDTVFAYDTGASYDGDSYTGGTVTLSDSAGGAVIVTDSLTHVSQTYDAPFKYDSTSRYDGSYARAGFVTVSDS